MCGKIKRTGELDFDIRNQSVSDTRKHADNSQRASTTGSMSRLLDIIHEDGGIEG